MQVMVLAILFSSALALAAPPPDPDADGRTIMNAVYQRHHFYPYVYEEQSMILIDRNQNRETRKLRRYSRVNADTSVEFLLLFDAPEDVRGVAVRATKRPDGHIDESLYLPAFGRTLVKRVDASASSHVSADESFLGTDFSVENITGEVLKDYLYQRRADEVDTEISYYVIDVFRRGESGDISTTSPLRRHYIRQDNLYIMRTDHFNNLGRLRKRQTNHDLVVVLGEMWRANMILMENFEENHRTIIKIDRRVFSADYVPLEVFSDEWLFTNAPTPKSEEDPVPTAELEPAAATQGVPI